MSNIGKWSPSAASNNAPPPDGAPEGMPASSVNDTIRENMSAVRRWADDGAWFDREDAPVYVSADTFQVPGDLSAVYQIGRRVRVVQTATVYGEVASVVVSANTDVTLALDSGSLANEAMAVSVGPEQTSLGIFGSAANLDVGTDIGDVVQLEDVGGAAGLPAVDGSQLTGLPIARVALDEQTASSSAEITFTTAAWFAAPYRSLELEFLGFAPDTDGSELLLRFSTDGGTTYLGDSGGTDYSYLLLGVNQIGSTITRVNPSDSSYQPVVNIDVPSLGVYGNILVRQFSGGTPSLSGSLSWRRQNSFTGGSHWGEMNSPINVNAMKLLMSSGLIASGSVRLYGLQ